MSRSRNRYVGSWTEVVNDPLDLPFDADTLQSVLRGGANGQSPHTHQQISDWAERFALTRRGDAKPATFLALVVDVAEDVGAQWHLRLVNSYSLPELQRLDFALEAMPSEWFEEWVRRLSLGAV